MPAPPAFRRFFIKDTAATSLVAFTDHPLYAADSAVADLDIESLFEASSPEVLAREALGVPDYSMSSILVTMMLDGLSKKHTLKLRA